MPPHVKHRVMQCKSCCLPKCKICANCLKDRVQLLPQLSRLLDASYFRTFALELKERLAQTLAAFVTSVLTGPHRRLDAKEAAEPPLRQIIDVLQLVMCTHDAEKLAISVLEIYRNS